VRAPLTNEPSLSLWHELVMTLNRRAFRRTWKPVRRMRLLTDTVEWGAWWKDIRKVSKGGKFPWLRTLNLLPNILPLVGIFIAMVGIFIAIFQVVIVSQQTKITKQQYEMMGQQQMEDRLDRLIEEMDLSVSSWHFVGSRREPILDDYDAFRLQRRLESVALSFGSSEYGGYSKYLGDFLQALIKADFDKCPQLSLNKIKFSGASLEGALLNEAELKGCHLERVFLREAVLTGVDLSGADLDLTNLEGVNLRDANLRQASCRKVSLRRADLRGANFEMADLSEADLEGIDLLDTGDVAWHQIKSLKGTNLLGVKNAPPGFLEWAVDTMGAVQMRHKDFTHHQEANEPSSKVQTF
jgi:hypothetical protein